MKITILGSCRQEYIKNIFPCTNIQDNISYPHYTKEIIQVINFCKFGNLLPEETLYTFRSPILYKIPLYFNEDLKNEFENSDLFILEIASKIVYEYDNKFVHHIAIDNNYITSIKNKIKIRYQDKNEIEDDIINIKNILNKPIIIVSHLVTKEEGERYKLKCWLEDICLRHNILFIDPIKELKEKNCDFDKIFKKEDVLNHYTYEGHNEIGNIYKTYINKIYL
jgi:hypothetical protein